MQKSKAQILDEAATAFKNNVAEAVGNYDSMMEPENKPNDTRIGRIESMCCDLQKKSDQILRNMASELVNNNGEQAILDKKKRIEREEPKSPE
jgi:DNA anti-recombination protein RmuC